MPDGSYYMSRLTGRSAKVREGGTTRDDGNRKDDDDETDEGNGKAKGRRRESEGRG
jgi:hypothetical protein